MRDVLKNYKVLLWLFLIVISIFLIGPSFGAKGVVVIGKEKNSTVPLSVGDIIYKINGADPTPTAFGDEYYGVVRFDTNYGEKTYVSNGSLGRIDVRNVKSSRLNFGLDIEGGIRAVVKPNSTENITVNQIIEILRSRINIYGLREFSFRPLKFENQDFIEISIAGGTENELRELLGRQGKFEAKIPIRFVNSTTLNLDRKYFVAVSNSSIIIDNVSVENGKSITFAGMPFTAGISQNSANLTATVFTGNDIVLVYFDPQRSRVEAAGNGYQWSFIVQITQQGAGKFSMITNNLNKIVDPNTGQGYLSSKIELYLDGQLVDSLNIAADLKGQEIREPSITGFAPTLNEAVQEQRRLQSVLRSGSLPTTVEIVQMDVVSPNLGSEFLGNVLLAIFAAVAAVSVVISIRYKKVKIVIPMLLTSMSEIIIILGLSVVIGWTIDLAAIAAIIAIIGTGIDAQIILIDQALRSGERFLTTKEKVQRAFLLSSVQAELLLWPCSL